MPFWEKWVRVRVTDPLRYPWGPHTGNWENEGFTQALSTNFYNLVCCSGGEPERYDCNHEFHKGMLIKHICRKDKKWGI